MPFAGKFGNKYGRTLIDTAIKTEMNVAETASKRVIQKNEEATGDLIGNKIEIKLLH